MTQTNPDIPRALTETVLLIGFMGSGKTSVGQSLAFRARVPFLDTDEMISRNEGRPITEIFAQQGEEAFREMETALLKKLLEDRTGIRVISVGGGMPVREENRKLMRSLGKVIYLKASPEVLEKRLEGDKSRPLLQGGDLHQKILSMMEKRREIYEDAADISIFTDHMTVRETAKRILKMF